MRKLFMRILICTGIVFLIAVYVLLSDRQKLNDSIIRFHVVANSDSQKDQSVKFLIRDAVVQSIEQDLANVTDAELAKNYLQENLAKIESLANSVLEAAGFEERAVASICQEAFSVREYNTFSLPSGVYEALRIVIGEGEGQNWWCVSFPALCAGATSQEFAETAAQAGFSEHLTDSLIGEKDCELHFYLLDMLGKIENTFFTVKKVAK